MGKGNHRKVENLTMEEIVAQMMGNEAKETKFEYVPRDYDHNSEDLLTVKHLKLMTKLIISISALNLARFLVWPV